MADDEERAGDRSEPEPANEGTRAAREQAQETNELAEALQPPHDREATRSDPSPNP
jgi:hypothetical protein